MRRLLPLIVFLLFATARGHAAENRIEKHVDSLITNLAGSDEETRIAAAVELGDLGPIARDAVPGLIRALKSDDLAFRHEVVMALGHMGPQAAAAVPALTKLLGDKSVILRHSALHALRRIGRDSGPAIAQMKRLLRDKDQMLNVPAAWALAVLQSDDKQTVSSTIPVLVKGLESSITDVRNDSVFALGEIGAPAASAVADLLGQANPSVCSHACDALAGMGLDGKAAVPVLLSRLDDADESVRWHAARALGGIGSEADQVVPALAKLLSDQPGPVRANAAFAIGQFGSEAKSAVPELMSALLDENVNVRLTAAKSLGAIGPDAKAAVPALAKLWDDDVGAVTINAAEAMGQIGSASVPVLTEKLSDPGFRTLAVSVLSQIGPDAKAAVPELVKLLGSDDEETRIEVLLAIAEIGPGAEAAVEPLLKRLRSPAAKNRAGAAYALAKIEAEAAIPALKQTVKDKDEMLRLASGWALVRFEPKNAEYVRIALPGLIKGLSHEMPVIRREMAEVLGMIGPAAKSAVPDLLGALRDDSLEVRTEALTALAEIDATNELVLKVAVKALQNDDHMIRYAGGFVLGRAGAKASAAIPELKQKLKSRDPFEKTVAAWALLNISPKGDHAKTAVPILVEAMKHQRPTVRAEVAATLGKAGVNSASVRAALETATKDEDEEVREAATEALKKLEQ